MSGGAAVLGATVAPRTISSRQTLPAKVIGIIWIVLFGVAPVGLWLGLFHGQNNEPPPVALKWISLAVWVAGSALISWGLRWIKKVRIDAGSLYVSNYLREIVVSLSEIERITENRWINGRPVTIHLRHDSAFGRKITFMPKVKFLMPWRPHPIVAELRDLAGKLHRT